MSFPKEGYGSNTKVCGFCSPFSSLFSLHGKRIIRISFSEKTRVIADASTIQIRNVKGINLYHVLERNNRLSDEARKATLIFTIFGAVRKRIKTSRIFCNEGYCEWKSFSSPIEGFFFFLNITHDAQTSCLQSRKNLSKYIYELAVPLGSLQYGCSKPAIGFIPSQFLNDSQHFFILSPKTGISR